ncbi:MAG: hypothetical protein M3N29_10450 [Chloroflexota bacterium]|nr:hypothetical protein [Chloroflexota bacterium]
MTRNMPRGDIARNRTFAALREEFVWRDDGRYLIYYSWPPDEPDADDAANEAGDAGPASPPQQPWSPELGPTDV